MRDGNAHGDLHDRPIGDLMRQLADETTTLVRQEIELAKAEVAEKGRKAGVGFGMWGAAGLVAVLALGALTAALILALDLVLPTWAAALVVTALYAAIAAVLFLRGRERVEEAGPPLPGQTVETLKEDVEWARTQAGSARR